MRRGFSLVELLVVVAIIGVLIGLLLPAVQKARESTKFMHCKSNLRQLGMAAHSYQHVHSRMPIISFGDSITIHAIGSLLPHMEEGHNDGTVGVKVLTCPSRRTQWNEPKNDYGVANLQNTIFYQQSRYDYPLPYDRRVPTLKGIKDGASNTILFAHKGLDPEFYAATCQFPAGSEWLGSGDAWGPRYAPRHDLGWKHDHSMANGFSVDFPAGIDMSRYPYAFLRDRKNGYPTNDYFFANVGYETRVPCWELLTSPHTSMPCLFADGAVRDCRFTAWAGHEGSVESLLIVHLWTVDDGVVVHADDLGN